MMWRATGRLSLSSILPVTACLPDGRQVTVNVATETQVKETYSRLKACGDLGEGIGLDEFPSEESFRNEIGDGDCYVVICSTTGNMVASFILAVSKYYRGCSEAVDPYLIVHHTERQKGIGSFCMNLIVDFSKRLGYQGMYIDTFCNNEPMKRIIETVGGFSKVGYLPLGGKLQDGSVVGSYIYYRPLG